MVTGLTLSRRFGLGPRPGQPLVEAPELRARIGLWTSAVPLRLYPSSEALLSIPARAAISDLPEGQREGARKALRQELKQRHDADLAARLDEAVDGDDVMERFVAFLANGFTVSAVRKEAAGLVGAFEKDVVRTNVAGNFVDMLLASARHPAMLVYLDNATSVGPNSKAGSRRGRGLNENLAREILELHTLGAAGGYTQADVTAFARVLTGWTVDRETGRFKFRPETHEPGDQTVLGRTFADRGEETGVDVLQMLALHPATSRRFARRLVTHYIADDPPEAAVIAVDQVFRETQGHFPSCLQAVLDRPEVLTPPLPKLRTPWDLATATLRLAPLGAWERAELSRALARMGQPWGQAPSPEGWSDQAEDWLSPDAFLGRFAFGRRAAGRLAALHSPLDAAELVLGPDLDGATRNAIVGAGSREDGLALLFCSPRFQRR